jgi:antitoxin SocA-like protein
MVIRGAVARLINRYILNIGKAPEASMGNIQFSFERDKAIEAILYLARRAKEPDFHSINKILYVADKISLERYGRFICGDSYCAMEWGPVPSNTYDLMKYGAGPSSPFEADEYIIKTSRDANLEEFSESDIECLDEGLTFIGNSSFNERHNKTADLAYRKAWAQRGNGRSVPIKIEDIAELLENSRELVDHLSHRG